MDDCYYNKKDEITLFKQNKTILVTGGAGFIGSHLIKYLLDLGNNVISIDNYFSGKKQSLENFRYYPRFEMIRHDIIEPIRIEVDEIYHLACPASPVHYQKNPIYTMKTCFLGTMNMLGLAKRSGAKIVVASTSEIYGDPLIHPQPESYYGNVNCVGTRSCYDEGKRIAESLCVEYYRQHNVDVRIARIFNTFGPSMLCNDGRVISNFITEALNKQPLSIYGDGTQTRSFCYISDLVKGLYKLMNIDRSNIQGDSPFNLGNPNEISILKLANIIRNIIDPSLEFSFRTIPSDDPKKRKPDISKARDKLGWEPEVSFEEGLKLTIEDFKMRFTNFNNDPSSISPIHQTEAHLIIPK
ncbi:NAD dependent epimerase/dehydratase family protein [Cryptosporidium serpentis]